jgi:hypothetical protein
LKNNIVMTFWVIVCWPCLRWYIHGKKISKTKLYKFRIYLSISRKALGTLPGDGNVMPKHVGATIHN